MAHHGDLNVCISSSYHKLKTELRTPSKEIIVQQTILSPLGTGFTAWPSLESRSVFSRTIQCKPQIPVRIVNTRYSLGTKSQTYRFAAYVSGGSRGTALQVLGWQGIDNGECSQTREDSEDRETHLIGLRIEKLEVSSNVWSTGAVNRTYLYLSSK